MSYILDALKKSEKERQRGTIPDMLTVQDIVAEKPKKRFLWICLLTAGLALNAGIFVWWLGLSHTGKPQVAETSIKEKARLLPVNDEKQTIPEKINSHFNAAQPINQGLSPVPGNSSSVAENSLSADTGRNSDRKTDMQGASDIAKKIAPDSQGSAGFKTKPSEFAPAKPNQPEMTVHISSGPANPVAEMPDESKIYKLRDLPSHIQQDLPSFSIAALMYSSNPSSRMVRINDQMMYEGQDLTAGIKLEEITNDGVIFRYQKYKFYVGVK